MAGPWFTVQEVKNEWQELSHIWISNGHNDWEGKVEIKVSLARENSLSDIRNKLVLE